MFPLSDFQFHPASFWLGVITATILWWVITALNKYFPKVKERFTQRLEKVQTTRLSGIDSYLKLETHHLAQRQHIANELFPLDDILIIPRLVAPPPNIDPEEGIQHYTVGSLLVPHTPQWPEISSHYRLETISIPDAIHHKVNIAIVGPPGSGKSVALAYMAGLVCSSDAKKRPKLNFLPLLFHISDLDTEPAKTEDPLENIIDAVSLQFSALVQSQLPRIIRTRARQGKILLLIDGLDELPPTELSAVVSYLNRLTTEYPGARIITTADDNYVDGLIAGGFYPLTIAAWHHDDRERFVEKWAAQWSEKIAGSARNIEEIDPRLIVNWLRCDDCYFSPLEWTLKVWGAFTGDLKGATTIHAVESYIQRLTAGKVPHLALESLADEMLRNEQSKLPISRAEKILAKLKLSSEAAQITLDADYDEEISPQRRGSRRRGRTVSAKGRIISTLIDNGLVTATSDNHIRFTNPYLTAYLASFRERETPDTERLLENPFNWGLKPTALRFIAAGSPTFPHLDKILREENDPLYRRLLMAGRWLRDIPSKYEWRVNLMRHMANILQRETTSFNIRVCLLNAFAISNDPSRAQLFKQLLTSNSPDVRQLGALGCGAIRDSKTITELVNHLSDPSADVRLAACLALGAMRRPDVDDILKEILYNGEENTRRTAAESYAVDPVIGRQYIEEALASEDLLTRRAAVFGLSRIRRKWALDLLENIAIEDSQWVVRNAASQAIENLQKPDHHIPVRLPPPDSNPWVLALAGKHGIGIIPGETPTDLLLLVMQSNIIEERLAALAYLRLLSEDKVIKGITDLVNSTDDQLVEAAGMYALWFITISGKIPVK